MRLSTRTRQYLFMASILVIIAALVLSLPRPIGGMLFLVVLVGAPIIGIVLAMRTGHAPTPDSSSSTESHESLPAAPDSTSNSSSPMVSAAVVSAAATLPAAAPLAGVAVVESATVDASGAVMLTTAEPEQVDVVATATVEEAAEDVLLATAEPETVDVASPDIDADPVMTIATGTEEIDAAPPSAVAPPDLRNLLRNFSLSALVSAVFGAIGQLIRNPRNRNVALGLVLIGCAQYVMAQRDPVLVTFTFADTLLNLFHIDIPNINNAIFGTLLLLGGGYLVATSLAIQVRELSISTELVGAPSFLAVVRGNLVPLLMAVVLFIFLISQLALPVNNNGLVAIWAVVLGVLVLVGFNYDRQSKRRLLPRIERIDLLVILGIFIAGLAVGVYRLDTVPNSLVGDEGGFLERAEGIVQGKEGGSFFSAGVYSFPLPSSMYQAAVMEVFGTSLWSWRFSSVIAGLLTIVPLYLLCLELFDRRIAIVTNLLMVMLPYFVAFERMGYNNSQAILPVALAIYLLYIGIRSQSLLYFILSGLVTGLGFYTYSASRLGLVAELIVLAYFLGGKVIRALRAHETRPGLIPQIRWLFLFGVMMLVSVAVVIVPYNVAVNASNPNLLNTKTFESLFNNVTYATAYFDRDSLFRDYPPIEIGDQTLFFRLDLYGILLSRGVIRSTLALNMESGLTDSIFVASPLAGPVTAPFFFIGSVIALIHLRKPQYFITFFWVVSGIVLLSVVNSFPPRHTHMVSIIPALCILTAVGLTACADFLGNLLPSPSRWAVPGVLIIALGFAAVVNWRNYFEDMPKVYTPDAENIMAFTALQLKEPRSMIYVTDDPQRKNFEPYLMRLLPTNARYQAFYIDDFVKGSGITQPDQSYTYFFPDSVKNTVIPHLEDQ
ncbi:MAG TPA: glycosyltransferase family 39 protein, partial [Aggregatilineales bacterium]|nr:glycosyltransferase family 39 protein [Aggregatilineales bacterium]